MSNAPAGAPAAAAESLSVQRHEAEAIQKRGTRQLLLARALFMAASYVASVLLARELGPSDFGVYGVLLATLAWLEIVSYAGVPAATGRLIPEHQDEAGAVERSARFVLLVTSLALFAISWILAPQVARVFHLDGGTWLFRVAILDIPVAAVFQGYAGTLMGLRRFGPLSVGQAVMGTAKLGGVLALFVAGFTVAHALVVNVLATTAALLFLLVIYPPRGFLPSPGFVRRIVGLAVSMGAFVISLQVLISLDVWFLGSVWKGPGAAVGQYLAALKIAQTLIVIPIVQSGVLLASVAWALAARDREGARAHVLEASRFSIILSAAACVIVGGNASSLMDLLYSSAYAAGGRYLVVQLLAFSCFALMDVYAHALMGGGRQRVTAAVLVSFIPIVAIANLLLIPRLGPMGAAASLLIGMGGTTAAIGVLVWKQFGAPIAGRTLARVALATVVVLVPALMVPARGGLVLVKMAALGVLYLGVLWLTGEISAADFVLPSARRDAAAEA
ncbi:MAG TPA: oligosaccharide flippase family protein [Gemmatimonadaceae bacterium]|nr:oligosaccharide flippase family protein [Gemmatimonadaceae bacterium]